MREQWMLSTLGTVATVVDLARRFNVPVRVVVLVVLVPSAP